MDLPFFFQAEDGIRDTSVTGVQTCALPIFRIYREKVPALQFAARPKRNLQLFEGQSPGANNGTGKLSFPTREQTILPIHLGGAFRNSLVEEPRGTYRFNYVAQDCTVTFVFVPRDGLSSLLGLLNNQAVGVLMDGAA